MNLLDIFPFVGPREVYHKVYLKAFQNHMSLPSLATEINYWRHLQYWALIKNLEHAESETERYNHYKVLNAHSVNSMQSLQGVKYTMWIASNHYKVLNTHCG